jgi:GNAT superfamily N-acetyltransferase
MVPRRRPGCRRRKLRCSLTWSNGLEPDPPSAAGRGEAASRFWDWLGGHIPSEPVWVLDVAGVDPAVQGQGLGRRLIWHGLARASAEGPPAPGLRRARDLAARLVRAADLALTDLRLPSLDDDPDHWTPHPGRGRRHVYRPGGERRLGRPRLPETPLAAAGVVQVRRTMRSLATERCGRGSTWLREGQPAMNTRMSGHSGHRFDVGTWAR